MDELLKRLGEAGWQASAAEAQTTLERLAGEVRATPLPSRPRLVAGGDVAYAPGGAYASAAIAVWDVREEEIVASATISGVTTFPYVPALFAFREAPLLLSALARLEGRPDLLLCDGQGQAHPLRCGLACVVGLARRVPTVGCAKSRLIGTFAPPGPERGERAPLLDGGEVVGMVLRTRAGVRPLFISVGHAVTLDEACAWVLRTSLTRRPEPLRAAHRLAQDTLAQELHTGTE
jgi:deoxyribonuclease V